VGDGEQLFEGASHRAPSSAAGEHKRAVDVEEDDFDHGRNRFYVRFRPRRFRLSGCFAANVSRPRSFGRRLFFEADALAFVQLVEAALHRAPMKKPLLPAVVADEAETPVSNESLDRAARHRVSSGRAGAQSPFINFRSTTTFALTSHAFSKSSPPHPRADRKHNACVQFLAQGATYMKLAR